MTRNPSVSSPGFTLIELTIVIALVGILSSIALPTYVDFLQKARIASSLAEIASGRTFVESQAGSGVAINSPDAIGLRDTTERCNISVNFSASGSGTITCTMIGFGAVAGATVTLTRTADPQSAAPPSWACTTSLIPKLRPKECA